MQPDAWRDLLLNLKLQLLALPSLLRWGVLAFAGVVVLREGITAGWHLYHRRRAEALPQPGPGSVAAGEPPGTSTPAAALPGPDPLSPDFSRHAEMERAEPTTPAGGTKR